MVRNKTLSTVDHLIDAFVLAEQTCQSLRDALSTATPLEALVILALLERAAILNRDIQAVREAVKP